MRIPPFFVKKTHPSFFVPGMCHHDAKNPPHSSAPRTDLSILPLYQSDLLFLCVSLLPRFYITAVYGRTIVDPEFFPGPDPLIKVLFPHCLISYFNGHFSLSLFFPSRTTHDPLSYLIHRESKGAPRYFGFTSRCAA